MHYLHRYCNKAKLIETDKFSKINVLNVKMESLTAITANVQLY